ncbi:hypothetical protein BCY84_00430 [Trypanosoma cruzi cruzi]|nr:hypothetical protein BCY84_00430 [Trypanosoma cruzi cruzi]
MSLSSSSRAHGAGTAAGETDVRGRWCPLLDLLSVDTDVADGASVSLMIVAHVTYRSALLTRALRLWRHRRKVVVERRHWQACLAVEWHARRRSFLFFRAWQWRYREVQQHKANTETAEGHCVKVALRRAMEAWKTWSHAASELKARVTAMGLRTMKSLLLRCWNAWHHHAQRCIACNKLTTAAAIWRQQSCWVVWRHVTWKRRCRRLHVAALLLHVPVAWMEGGAPVAATSSCAPPTCSAHTPCLREKLAWGLLAMRFYWIRWLGGTARRRAIRLHRHEMALEQIESHRDRRAMAHGYQRWLMRTASTLHSRRSALVIFCAYFYRWLLFSERQAVCERRRSDAACRCKSDVLQHWRERTLWRQLCTHRVAQAESRYDASLRSRLLRLSFQRWLQRMQSRCGYRALEQAAPRRRRELLRHLTVNRLVSSVLMTYWRSGGEAKSFHEDPQSTKATGAVMMASTAADAETSFASPSAAACVEPHKGTVCERVVNDGSVEVFRRRLVARCAAIPPAVRHAHMGTAAAPRRAAGGIDTASRVDAAVISSATHSCALGGDVSPPLHLAAPTPAVSLNASMATVCSDSSITVAEGKRLLLAYRAMLAAASAERDEARILREKLRLYSTQGRNCVGVETLIAQAEAQLRQRLLVLQQLDLDRQALRAQVVRMAKQLEVILQPSDRFTGLLMEGER